MKNTNTNKRTRRRHANHLYALRRNRRYGQKHVAHLLGHKGKQMVCRCENGHALPSLQTALMLQIIYGTQIQDIYPELYRRLQMEAVRREEQLRPSLGSHIRGRVLGED